MQDALGRQTVIDQPYYSSAKMLAGGLLDFSVEAGVHAPGIRRELQRLR